MASDSTPCARPQLVPEILAPVGSLEAFDAALASGADALYLGLSEGFQARARSTAFDLAGLPGLVARAHTAAVKVYLTLNTLVFESELGALERVLRAVIAAGVDALIVQDPAVALLARELCPELPLHASTQMTISSADGARFAATLGICRVVLPRELSLQEIARFTQTSPLESEVFIHGALCMAWSGQCLTSEAFSERSANRGQCSQACRMPYDLIVDGMPRDLGDTRYLLSPRDLAAQELVPELMAAGVHCFKIEGRYKNAAYVLAAVDAVRSHRAAALGSGAAEVHAGLQSAVTRTRLTFSRDAALGFFRGDDHQALVDGRTPKHRGIRLGRISELRGRQVVLELADTAAQLREFSERQWPRAGMGVMFDVGDPERDDAPGGPIFSVQWRERAGRVPRLELGFGQPGPDLSRVRAGVDVWLTGDPELARQAERRVQQLELEGRIGVRLRVRGALGERLDVSAEAEFAGRPLRARAESSSALAPARSGGLTDALLCEKLAALGGSGFRLEALDTSELAPGQHLPVSELKSLRRGLVGSLQRELTAPVWRIAYTDSAVERVRARPARQPAPLDDAGKIVPLCRTMEQLEAVIACGVTPGDEVELDWMELVGLARAVERARAAGLGVSIATVRVQKPGEESYDRRIAALAPDAVLVRHWGALMHFAASGDAAERPALHGDFSLNVTNSLSARHVLSLGLHTLTAAHDLDRTQLLALLEQVPRGRVAVTLHHHMPTFHNSHCVYAHLLSEGRDYRSCGRPCEQHRAALRDFAGYEHPVLVDVSCRNTVFNALAQSAAPLVPALLERGVRRFRVEFVWERGDEVTATLGAYRALLRGEMSAKAAMRRVGVHEQYGLTLLRGSAEVRAGAT